MLKSSIARAGLVLVLLAAALFDDSDQPRAVERAARPLGKSSALPPSGETFLEPMPNLSPENLTRFRNGIFGFRQVFIPAPSQFGINDGLGPLYNNHSCFSCHRNGGRGRPPNTGKPMKSMILRIGISTPKGSSPAVPEFGIQLQHRAVEGFLPEARTVDVRYTKIEGTFADGSRFTLVKPTYLVQGPHAPLPAGFYLSPRIAPPVIGMGLLEAVPESTIRALADPEDKNRDGISGRVHFVWNRRTERFQIGRFGWKSEQPTIRQQVASAYNQDMGITNRLYPKENHHNQKLLRADSRQTEDSAAGHPELSDRDLEITTFAMRTITAPAPRAQNDDEVQRGKDLFRTALCNRCHLERLATSSSTHPVELASRTIHPYTDLLLHDMGTGLADDPTVQHGIGREWRTAPLWGIGLTRKISGHTRFLHDGRARSLMEAILWHGGEASTSADKVKRMSAKERAELISFLNAL
jgi:CxxC motif-containing protein (DUF1111 family)